MAGGRRLPGSGRPPSPAPSRPAVGDAGPGARTRDRRAPRVVAISGRAVPVREILRRGRGGGRGPAGGGSRATSTRNTGSRGALNRGAAVPGRPRGLVDCRWRVRGVDRHALDDAWAACPTVRGGCRAARVGSHRGGARPRRRGGGRRQRASASMAFPRRPCASPDGRPGQSRRP